MKRTAHQQQRVTARTTVAAAVVACVAVIGATCGGSAVQAQTLREADPPTIEKVIVSEQGVAIIEGLGKPGDMVLLLSAGAAIGEAQVGNNGRWRVALKEGLKPGTHQIRAEARATPQGNAAAGDEIRIAIPSEIGAQAVVAYDGVTGDEARATRQRAEELAQAAGQAYDDVRGGKAETGGSAEPRADEGAAAKEQPVPQSTGPVAVVIDWLKRSARGYREEVVGKLGVAAPGSRPSEPEQASATRTVETSAAEAAATIAKDRAAAEARQIDLAEADTVRKAQEAQKAEAEARKKEAAKREKAEELARRKAEYDRIFAIEMERLKKAKEEADRGKAATPAKPPQKANITLERFYLPGQKRPPREDEAHSDKRVAVAADADEDARERPARRSANAASSRCAEGRVIKRKGRRWYVTGADDTLWDIAERFYGTGTAYPRIYRVNRTRLSSPHVVRPCLALRLPGRRG